MVDILSRMHELTRSVMEGLDDATFEQLESFAAERARFVKRLQQSPIGEAEKAKYRQKVAEILAWDKAIVEKMAALKEEAAGKLVQLRQARAKKQSYETPYASINKSLFYDSSV